MIQCILFIVSILSAKYYTNTNYIHQLVGYDSIVFCATNGGLVSYSLQTNTFQVITNTDGLPMNRQNCLDVDDNGYIWAGCELGLSVVNTNFEKVRTYPIECLTCTRIQTITTNLDTIYIGSANGLLVIETKGTSNDFTDDIRTRVYETNGLPSDNILSIAVDDTTIWVGTDNGIAHCHKDFDPTYTRLYNTSQGLLSNYIKKIFIKDTSIYVATDLGLNIFNQDHFDTLLTGYSVNDISYLGDSLVLVLDSDDQVAFFYQNSLTIINDSLPYKSSVNTLKNINGTLFCGLGNRYTKDCYGNGIGEYHPLTRSWTITKRPALPSNHISEITANSYGVFIACGARRDESQGIGWLKDDGEWINFSKDSILPSDYIHRCTTAPDGQTIWFGINTIDPHNPILFFSFNPFTDRWNFLKYSIGGMDSTVAVWDIELDSRSNIYLALAGPSDKVWVIDSSLSQAYFLGERTSGFNVEFAIDSTGRVWRTMIGAEGGLVMIDTKNTLFDRSDDRIFKYGESDGLLSKYALGCVIDKNNVLYLANDVGFVRIDSLGITGINLDDDILDVELDSESRPWFMGRNGIYCYDPDFEQIVAYKFNELNVHIEFLPASNELIQVQAFEFDPLRHCFWIGGETGLLKLTLEPDTSSALDSILIYPNPLVQSKTIRIKNLPPDSRIDIYSITGRLIARNLEPDPTFGEVKWQIPEDIGSGLYYALIKSGTRKKVCKFAIIR